jgi:hypothetical protein
VSSTTCWPAQVNGDVPDPLGPIVIRAARRVSARPCNAIGRERGRLGLKVSEAAARLGVSQEAMRHLERAKGRKPQSVTLTRLARAGFDVDRLKAEMAVEQAERR